MWQNDRGNVLIVDDHPVNRMIIRKMLEAYPVNIDEAADGMTAVQMAAETEYALVFLDCVMPGWDGVRTAKELCARAGANIPYIVTVSGEYQENQDAELYKAGAKLLLLKPLQHEQIRHCLTEAGIPLEEEWKERSGYRTGQEKPALQRALIQAVTEQLELVRQSLEEKASENWSEKAEHACHTLKGLMATMEEKELGACFASLLNDIRSGEREAYMTHAAGVYKNASEWLLQWKKRVNWKNTELSDSEEQEGLMQVRAAEQITPEQREALLTAIRLFDYDEVLRIYDEMCSGISGKLQKGLRKARELAEQFQYAKSQEYFQKLIEK